MSYIFQFGSNLNLQRLNSEKRLKGKAKFIKIAKTIERFKLDFTTKGYENCAAADLVPDSNGVEIWGALYKIPDEIIFGKNKWNDKRTLDDIEEEGEVYRRVEIRLKDENNLLIDEKVFTYLVIDKIDGLKTCYNYVKHIIKGINDYKMPLDYKKYVINQIVKNNPALKNKL